VNDPHGFASQLPRVSGHLVRIVGGHRPAAHRCGASSRCCWRRRLWRVDGIAPATCRRRRDARRCVGSGNARASSGGETRVIRTIYGPTRKYVEMAARALTLWGEWDRVSSEPFYKRTGVLWLTGTDDSYARRSLPLPRDLRLEYDEMDPAVAAKRWPQISDRRDQKGLPRTRGRLSPGQTRMRWCRARTCADRLNIPPGCRRVGQAEWPTTRDPAQRRLEAGRGPVCVCVRAMAGQLSPM
jgi:hypothetical protein